MISDLGGKFTIILIEQYIQFAKEVCDDFIVFSRGALARQGQGSFSMPKLKPVF